MEKKNGLTKVEWIAMTIAVIGVGLNAFVLKESYYLWLVSNSLFIWFSFKNKHYGLTCLFAVQLLFTFIGIFYWR